MGINVIDPNGTDRVITGINVIDPSGTDRALVQINVIDPNGTDRVVWTSSGSSTLAVSATPTSVGGSTTGGGSATTGTTTASASGGTAPYTYSWSLTYYDNVVPPTINAPNAATTSFTQTNISYGGTNHATFQVTVKDSASPTPATATTTVTATWHDREGLIVGGTQ